MNCLSLNKCLVQTTVSDAALEMKSAAPRGPHVVSFSRGKHPAAGLLSLLTTGGLIRVRWLTHEKSESSAYAASSGSRRSRFPSAHVKKGSLGRGIAIAAANGGPGRPERL